MLPDIRAVIAAVVTALGLLTISFGVVAAFRVAQESRAGSLHAELAQRGRPPLPVSNAPRAILIVDTVAATAPVPDAEIPASAVVSAAAAATETKAETITVATADRYEVVSSPPVTVTLVTPAAEMLAIIERDIAAVPSAGPPVGGPYAEPALANRKSAPEANAAAQRAAKAAADKKARAARLARERRAASVRRATQARRAKANATASYDWDARRTNSFDSFNTGTGNAGAGTKNR